MQEIRFILKEPDMHAFVTYNSSGDILINCRMQRHAATFKFAQTTASVGLITAQQGNFNEAKTLEIVSVFPQQL